MYVQLRADPETDEVYARITLLPEADQTEITSPDSPLPDLKVAMSIHFARHLLHLTQAHMVDFLIFRGMWMIACLHWICPSSHPGRNWLQPIFVAMNGTFVTYFVKRPSHFCASPTYLVYRISWSCFLRYIICWVKSFYFNSMSSNEPVVSVDWLHANLKEPDMKVLDASWYMSYGQKNPLQEYKVPFSST